MQHGGRRSDDATTSTDHRSKTVVQRGLSDNRASRTQAEQYGETASNDSQITQDGAGGNEPG